MGEVKTAAECKSGGISRDEGEPENTEAILQSVGGFGRFQAMSLFLLMSLEIPMAMMLLLPVFIGASPTTWHCENATISKYKLCECEGDPFPIDITASIVTEWGLICESVWVSDTIFAFQWVGTIVGNMFLSQLSDRYGRRRCLLIIGLQMAFGSLLTAVAPNPYIYLLARFICGAGYQAGLNNLTSYTLEFMTPKWRPLGCALDPFGLGMMLLGLLAYLIRPWRTLALVTTAPFAILIFTFLLVPESPRWLLRQQKVDECLKVMKYIAKMNGTSNVDHAALQFLADKERKLVEEEAERNNQSGTYSTLDFYRIPELRRRMLSLQVIWFSLLLIYFGLSYNVKNMPGDPYLTMIYMGLVDFLAMPSSLLITNRLGRRKALILTMTLTALFLMVVALLQLIVDFTGYAVFITIFCVLSQFCIAAADAVASTFTAESFPTSIRTQAVGLAKIPGCLAAALSGPLVLVGSLWPAVPYFTFAVFAASGSLFQCGLAEPAGKPLEECIGGQNDVTGQQEDISGRGQITGKQEGNQAECVDEGLEVTHL